MHLIVTRTFPPEVGGMQSLMYGLAKSLSENVMIKVFADQYPNQDNFDKELSFSIERVSGPKIFKKYRKANLLKFMTYKIRPEPLFIKKFYFLMQI